MLTFNEYADKVNQAIGAISYPQEPDRLYEPIQYTMSLGGKRLRPILLLMACDAMGGDIAKALPAAVGLELFHNFTLLHDDVMDNADVRRGKPTVHRRWNDNVAILSGDAMLTMATQYIAKTDDKCLRQVIELFNKTAMEIYEGQQLDMDYEVRNDVSVADYIEMIRLKTSVLLGCACKMGAIIANASPEDANALYDMGLNLGLAFQLQDDVLDVWGDAATFGKAIGGDIMNNKKTFLLINATLLAKDETEGELRRWLTDEYAMAPEKVPAVRKIYERLGLPKIADDAISQYNGKALEALKRIDMKSEAREAFTLFINSLVHRSK
jgi:geranylgeranyl diphosphate synthase type II